MMRYDPTLYKGCARYYTPGRPPYSRFLAETLAAEARLDGTGRLFDVGCGPGPLALSLANCFDEAIGLDPDAEMLAEAKNQAATRGIENIRWMQSQAEDIDMLEIQPCRLVTFGQSFHWTDRKRVAEMVYSLLEPGGAVAIINHEHDGRPQPSGPGYPPIPHEAIRAIIDRYLGKRRRAGKGFASLPADPHENVLAGAGFGKPQIHYCVGRNDIVQDIDGVLANYLSTSFAAPHLFGDRLKGFEEDVRAELSAHSESGLFWDWPGDTQIVLAFKVG